MALTVQTVTVLGAGTMGAALAALLGDAGLKVHLLDLPSGTVQAGGTPDPRQRNQRARTGLVRMQELQPPCLYDETGLARIEIGNLEDDLERALAQSDWVLEAITEDLALKRALWSRFPACCPAPTFVSSNTSGLPIHRLTEGLDTDFARRCFGTHFFNPPRYLPLLELIPGPLTDPDLLREFKDFSQWRLGREVVVCKDTPYFIGNRFFAYCQQATINEALARGLSVGEVDALTGPLLGRPKTGTFRLADLVGLDVMEQACSNLTDLLPADAALQSVARGGVGPVLHTLTAAGHLGRKSGQGFYQAVTAENGRKSFRELDLAAARQGTVRYRSPGTRGQAGLQKLEALPLAERLPALLYTPSPVQDFGWAVLGQSLAYLAGIASELASSVYDIDRVMRWGFGWELGPFEIWDALGHEASLQEMEARDIACPPWIKVLGQDGDDSNGPRATRTFHRGSGMQRTAATFAGPFVSIPRGDSFHGYRDTLAEAELLTENVSASLKRGRDQILFLEIHSKLNTIDDQVLAICQAALEQLHGAAAGLVIANDDDIFSAGANLQFLLRDMEQGDWSELERRIALGQSTLQALREAPKPVVTALRGLALGGGVEVVLAADRAVAYRDARLGLVETRVGLIPGWGGCKEMVRRHLDLAGDWDLKSPERTIQALVQMIGQAQVSSQAEQARRMGLLDARDTIVGRSSQILSSAEATLRTLQQAGYRPPVTQANVYAGGTDLQANLTATLYFLREGQYLTEYDRHIASKLIHVLSGGPLTTPAWMDEQYFLDLEREAILSLLGEAKTQARIHHMLTTGKPLAN